MVVRMPEPLHQFLFHPVVHALWHNWPLTVGTFLYMYQMMIFWWDNNLGGAIMFFGYTVGNVGIMVGVITGMVAH